MKGIYIFTAEGAVPANIGKLFDTYGPCTIEGRRLDFLNKVVLLVDDSTVTTIQSGTSASQAKTGSMIGRAVVGGILTGGAGAVIGGVTGKRESVINTTSIETLQKEITAELIFLDGTSMYVLLKNKKAFHWLLGFANQTPLTDSELQQLKLIELDEQYIKSIHSAQDKALDIRNNVELLQNTPEENNFILLKKTYEILNNMPRYDNIDYDEFLDKYKNNKYCINEQDNFNTYIEWKKQDNKKTKIRYIFLITLAIIFIGLAAANLLEA